jgi:hypothetical protein
MVSSELGQTLTEPARPHCERQAQKKDCSLGLNCYVSIANIERGVNASN